MDRSVDSMDRLDHLRWTLTMTTTLRLVVLASAIGAGLSAGVFLAFSSFVMTGLGRAPDAVGLRAMQDLNRAAPVSPSFMLVLLGTGVVAVGAAVAAGLGRAPGWPLVLAGATAYAVCALVTIGYHVPRNDALGRLDAADPAALEAWRGYVIEWTRMNHVRTAAAGVAAVLLTLAHRAS